jgi:glycosyltransferase involved in cell wall biosynthesis
LKKVIVSVTNDLTTDQRVDRVCNTLVKMGFDVLLVGRKLRNSLPLKPRNYRTKRMKLIFIKGPLFYAEYNLRLFFFLLFHRADILVSNDLDTLLANYLASGIRHPASGIRSRKSGISTSLRHPDLFHDCHEYFRGVPELNGRPETVKAWKQIEDWIFPKLKTVYAVNLSIADLYHSEYGNSISVIRNVPVTKSSVQPKSRAALGIPEKNKIILYQGAVNVDRGLEEAILAMKHLKTVATLLIIGTGDIIEKLKQLVNGESLNDRVMLTGQIPLEDLHPYTLMADLGLSIEKDVSINYHYCLPNKFLDYIQARVPVLVSPMPEMKAIIEKYRIGEFIESHDPLYLAEKFDALLNDPVKLLEYRTNLAIAASELCWEKEEPILVKIFEPYA